MSIVFHIFCCTECSWLAQIPGCIVIKTGMALLKQPHLLNPDDGDAYTDWIA